MTGKFICIVAFFLLQTLVSNAQSVPVLKLDGLFNQVVSKDTVYVVNFWATWCKPCVAELPQFDRLEKHFKGTPVKVILVSLDFKKDYSTRLLPFLNRKKIVQKVVLLDEPDYNSWLDKVSKTWSGAIPATLIRYQKKDFSVFLEKEITFDELSVIIEKQLNGPSQ